MGNKACSICSSHARQAIDLCIVNGTPVRSTAQQFGLSASAVQRHKRTCMKRQGPSLPSLPVPVYQSSEQVATAERVSLSIVARVSSLADVLEQQANECASDKDRRNMTGTATALLKALELNARLTGEISPNQNNIQINNIPSMRDAPEWGIFIRIIERHPEIRNELNQALLEAGQ